jgi:membrane-associated phospholipid phosphatase
MPWRIDTPGASNVFWGEIAVRIVIITFFAFTEDVDPFWREIQQEEVWLYKYPTTDGYVSTASLYAIAVGCSLAIIAVFFSLNRDFREAFEALMVPSLSIPLCGLITNIIKITVGRPRPDYFDRCYPGQREFNISLPCTGDPLKVLEGRKSFPSGHSGSSFSTMTFLTLYLAGKLGTFNERGRGAGWRLVVILIPMIFALLVAISRTCDYHHHWQDVTVGAILGIVTSYAVYRHYYPSLFHPSSELPLALLKDAEKRDRTPTPAPNRHNRPASLASSSLTLIKNV